MTRAVLSIGANLGDRQSQLQGAVDAFRPWLRAVSAVYETPPWGPVAQGPYLNAVLLAEDPGAAPGLWLQRAHAAEQVAGRTREVRWGPRTLDVDVVTVCGDGGGAEILSDDPDLTLPHPRAQDRAFVLVPWAALDPRALLRERAVRDWLAALPAADVAGVQPYPAVLT